MQATRTIRCLQLVGDLLVPFDQFHVGHGDGLRKRAGVGVHTRDVGKIIVAVNGGGRRNVEICRQMAIFDDAVVTDDTTAAHRTVEDDTVEADEHPIADVAWPVHDGTVGDRTEFADLHPAASLGMDDDTILDIGVRADRNGLHLAMFIYFVSADHGIGADENIFADDDLATDDRRWVYKGGFMDDGQMALRIFSNHGWALSTTPSHRKAVHGKAYVMVWLHRSAAASTCVPGHAVRVSAMSFSTDMAASASV